MPITSTVCGAVAMYNMFTVILAGGVGKNGSTVAVSQITIKKILCRFRSKTPLTLKKQQNNTHVNTYTASNFFFLMKSHAYWLRVFITVLRVTRLGPI